MRRKQTLVIVGSLVCICAGVYVLLHMDSRERVSELASARELLVQKERQLGALEQQLAELAEPQQLRDTMVAAQRRVAELNTAIRQVQEARAGLEEKNVALDNRLKNSAKEISRLVAELDENRKTVRKLEQDLEETPGKRKVQELTAAYEQSSRKLELMGRELADVRAEYETLRRERNELAASVSGLAETKAELAEKDREIANLRSALSRSAGSIQREKELTAMQTDLKTQMTRLAQELAAKEGQLKATREAAEKEAGRFAAQLDTLNATLKQLTQDMTAKEKEILTLQAAVASLNGHKDKENELAALNTELQRQLSHLQNQLEKKEQELAALTGAAEKNAATSAQTRNQLDEGLAKARQDLSAKDAEIAGLKSELARVGQSAGRPETGELEARIRQLTDTLAEKEKSLTELQGRLGELKQSAYSEKEVALLRNKLYRQQQEIDRVTDQYNRLKEQLSDIEPILTKREIDIAVKEKEIARLKSELDEAQSHVSYWEKVSSEQKGQEKQLLEELSQALDLNATLQQSLTEASILLNAGAEIVAVNDTQATTPTPPGASLSKKVQDKERVEELKKRVEIILKSVEAQD